MLRDSLMPFFNKVCIDVLPCIDVDVLIYYLVLLLLVYYLDYFKSLWIKFKLN